MILGCGRTSVGRKTFRRDVLAGGLALGAGHLFASAVARAQATAPATGTIDILGGVFGVVAALSALRERDRTGVGQKVSSSLFESATFMLGAVKCRQRGDRSADAANAGTEECLGHLRCVHRER